MQIEGGTIDPCYFTDFFDCNILKILFARRVRKASSILAAVAKYLLSDLFNRSHLLSCCCLHLADFFCQFHDFKSVFLLALCQQFFVDGVINAHAQ